MRTPDSVAPKLELSCRRQGAPELPAGEAFHCTVYAREAYLSDLAIELAKATGLQVLVDPDSAISRLSVAFPDISLLDLVRHVDGNRLDAGVLHVRAPGTPGDIGLTEPVCTLEPVRLRILPVSTPTLGAEIADAYCRLQATQRGTAVVAGSVLILRDVLDAVERGEHLWERLDPAAAARPRPEGDASPP